MEMYNRGEGGGGAKHFYKIILFWIEGTKHFRVPAGGVQNIFEAPR